MKITVLGGCGAWPSADQPCSGYLIESDGFRLLIDPGYATFPRLLRYVAADDVNAVFISHRHPDHCADLNPLLRARAFRDDDLPPALPVFAPHSSLEAVMALDRPGALADAIVVNEFSPGESFDIGPFRAATWSLPHMVANAGLRLSTGVRALAYTGDTGPTDDLVDMAAEVDVYMAEASYPSKVPADVAGHLSSAKYAGEVARRARVHRLMLTHLFPGTSRDASVAAAQENYDGPVDVAEPDTVTVLR